MDPYIAVAIFAANFAAGMLYALFVRYASKGDATKAANCSVTISLLMTLGIMQCVDNPWYLLPLLAGNWLGTHVAVQPPKFFWRIPMFRFLAIRFLACLALAVLAFVITASDADANSYGSYGGFRGPVRLAGALVANGVERRRDRRMARREGRQEARASRWSHAAAGYGSAGSHSYESADQYGGAASHGTSGSHQGLKPYEEQAPAPPTIEPPAEGDY